MHMSAEDAARHATVGEEWQALQDTVWAAEAGRDSLVATFAPALEAQLAALRKAVAEARGAADSGVLLDPASDKDEAQVQFDQVVVPNSFPCWLPLRRLLQLSACGAC